MRRACVLVLLCACSSPSRPPVAAPAPTAAAPAPLAAEPAPPPPTPAAADTPSQTAGGASFTLPMGWTLRQAGALSVLEAPEHDTRIAIVEVGEAASADAALAAAWKAYDAQAARALLHQGDDPGRQGWDAQHWATYETSPDEKRSVWAQAMALAGRWTVLLQDGAQGTLNKRGAQVALIVETLHPAGYQRESFAGKKAHALDAERVKRILAFVEAAQRALDIPGVAIALVQDGKVVFEGGLGVRQLGKPAKVDADTLFMIASNTKAMTTLLLAKLVDQGKLTWDASVAKLFPGFKLGNDAITAEVQVKHLVCACTGLPRQDLEWLLEFDKASAQTELDTLASVIPTSGFGEMYQYSNLLAAAGGFLAAHIVAPAQELGAAYDAAMRKEIFAPLGMKTITFDMDRALAGDHAVGHDADLDGKPAVVEMAINRAIVPLRPAGGAWASARDVRKYVQLELAEGLLPDGKRLVSAESLLARRKTQVTVGEHAAYGMGLETDTQWGVPVVHHGGSMIGFKSDMLWIPEAGVGAVILTNSDAGYFLLRPFMRFLLEVLYDGKPEAADDVAAAGQQRRDRLAKERTRWTAPADPALAAPYLGRFANPALGPLTVSQQGKDFRFDFGEWKSAVASRKNADGTLSFLVVAPGFQLELSSGERDGQKVLVLRDDQHEYVFAPVAAK